MGLLRLILFILLLKRQDCETTYTGGIELKWNRQEISIRTKGTFSHALAIHIQTSSPSYLQEVIRWSRLSLLLLLLFLSVLFVFRRRVKNVEKSFSRITNFQY